MKKRLILLLTVLLALCVLAACSAGGKKPGVTLGGNGNTDKPKETTTVSTYDSGSGWVSLPDRLCWEKVNEFPVVNENMTIEEARKLAVDFFRYAKTALWIPADSMEFIKNSSGSLDEMIGGSVYGGLPYVGVASGNIYRLMDYMDPKTGVVDIKNAVNEDEKYDGWKTFGNQCSIGAYWGFGRVINSANYKWTQNCLVVNKMPRVGPYTYDDSLKTLSGKETGTNTVKILNENGREVMFQSYAQLQPGDGMVYYTTAGHVVMISSVPEVVYREDGTIDGNRSFLTYIDQGQTWYEDGMSAEGTPFTYKGGVDTKHSFEQVFNGNYMPFTFLEFLGEDPFENSEATFSYTGDTITTTDLFASSVKANYGISDIYAVVYDENGNEVYRHAVRCTQANQKTLKLIRSQPEKSKVPQVETWGSLGFTPGKPLTVKIQVQLSTGERPTIYTGILEQG